MPGVSESVKRFAAALGVDVSRLHNTLAKARERVFRRMQTDVVLDVGANRGQYASALRASGYSGSIVSFEPIPQAFSVLASACSRDDRWQCHNIALGDANEQRRFRISDNLVSSSFHDVTEESIMANRGTKQVNELNVGVQTLDSFLAPESRGLNIHLKLDTQGSELEVLRGASESLAAVDSVECELSFVELYSGQPLFYTVSEHLYQQGFHAVWIERGFQSEERDLLQVDGLFVRTSRSE